MFGGPGKLLQAQQKCGIRKVCFQHMCATKGRIGTKLRHKIEKISASCDYGALTDELIRDRLVIGLKNQGDKVRLLREKTLNLQKAIQMCTSSEIASQQMETIEGGEDMQTEDVKKFSEILPSRIASIVVLNNAM